MLTTIKPHDSKEIAKAISSFLATLRIRYCTNVLVNSNGFETEISFYKNCFKEPQKSAETIVAVLNEFSKDSRFIRKTTENEWRILSTTFEAKEGEEGNLFKIVATTNIEVTDKEPPEQVLNKLPTQDDVVKLLHFSTDHSNHEVNEEEELPLNYVGPIPYASAVELGIFDFSK